MLHLARTGLREHRIAFAGTAAVVALAAALLSMTGVVVQTGLAHPVEGGMLLTLAESFTGTAVIAIVIVLASTIALALRQRRRQFALLLAIGATRRQVRTLVAEEITVLTLLAAPVGAVAGLLCSPVLTPVLVRAQVVPGGFELDRAAWPVLAATALLLPVTLCAAVLAARETVRIPPTAAVRESTVEPRGLGRGRRIAAVVLAVAGLPAALTPVFVPGIAGSAAAATSAFLLIGAGALAGPALIARLFARTSTLPAGVTAPPVRLALANSRGFARRLTAVIVPLAVALSVGTVQAGVDRAVRVGTTQQLRAGIHADLVVTAPGGLSAAQVASVAHASGVRTVEATATVPVRVRTDAEAPSALGWEYTQLRAVPANGTLLDPKVTAGSLAALARAGTVAISADARLDVGGGLGRHVVMRGADGAQHTATVVAVYERGLGFGDYLVGPGSARALAPGTPSDTVLVATSSPDRTLAALRALGLHAETRSGYLADATSGTAEMQHLSATLLLTLLVFIGLAAANTLVLTTIGRRRELDLLHRTGARRRQLVAMSAAESVIVSLTAWVTGTLAVVPALLGVNYGLTGAALPRIDIASYLVLSAAVLAVPLLCTVPIVLRRFREPAAAATTASRRRAQTAVSPGTR